jgi:excisionase family DNA binding protein
MLTVPEAAVIAGRDPETVRRWIRSGKLPSQRVGTQYLIDEADLDEIVNGSEMLPLPPELRETWTGEPPHNWVAAIRRSRRGH